jgi:HPt (histidine-containing phosphotransfer) domain-containing protein
MAGSTPTCVTAMACSQLVNRGEPDQVLRRGCYPATFPIPRMARAGNPMADVPIDEAVLNQLDGLKPGFASKIVALYLDTTPSVLKELESAALADDMAWLQIANHRLTSASVVIGAVRLAARCNELDRMLTAARVPDAAEWVRIIIEEYGRAEAALRSWRAGRQPGTAAGDN